MDFNKGLNIICGPINSGKTSTMVNLVNLESENKNVSYEVYNARILYALEPKILQHKGMDPKPQARFRYKRPSL